MSSSRRFAFVIPRFGEIVGGAEALAGSLARSLWKRGDFIELWTTCAVDNRSWENHFPAGADEVNGLPVRRFPVDERNLESWIPKQIAIHEGIRLSVDDELEWMAQSVNSAGLYQHIQEQAKNYDAIFFAPYLFGTTFWGSLVCPERSYLIPCLHDESYAYTGVIQSMFRKTAGCLFNAAPEQDLARALYGPLRGGVVGLGFTPFSEEYVSSLNTIIPGQYLLYAGRKETGKNVHLLVDHFVQAKEQRRIAEDINLVIIGGGSFEDLHRPAAAAREDIIDLGHVSEQEKHSLMRHALYVCQPSVNESFSIVIMEAWLLGTPAVVHARCAVTRHHVITSGGGLYFESADDFVGVTTTLAQKPDIRMKLAKAGENYVREEYSWQAVLKRFDNIMTQLLKTDTDYEQKAGGQ